MDTKNTLASGETGLENSTGGNGATLDNQTGGSNRVYTQQEFDDAMAKMKASVAKKAIKPYEDLGDPESIRQIKAEYEQTKREQSLKRGEFDTVIKEITQQKDAIIEKQKQLIGDFRVNTPLVSIAAANRSVNPTQVRDLLKPYVRLGENDDVEVLDETGKPRYNDRGERMSVEELVKTFLDKNPHFVTATVGTTSGKSSSVANHNKLDISKLDMSNPVDRAKYAEYRKTR